MTRSFGLVALVAVGAAQFAGAASLAQTAPTERELRILFIGQAVQRKGLPVLLSAFEALR